jgi:hypothetical protein
MIEAAVNLAGLSWPGDAFLEVGVRVAVDERDGTAAIRGALPARLARGTFAGDAALFESSVEGSSWSAWPMGGFRELAARTGVDARGPGAAIRNVWGRPFDTAVGGVPLLEVFTLEPPWVPRPTGALSGLAAGADADADAASAATCG